MFAKVFEQIYDSSIAENYLTRLVFEDMLTLADINGVVDKTHEAISRRTNVPVDVVKKGIVELEKPDGRSRRPDEDGRRIVRLDDHRDWGWLIVNYEYYRKIASEDQRREKTRSRVQKFREKLLAPPLQSPFKKEEEGNRDGEVEGESLRNVTGALHRNKSFVKPSPLEVSEYGKSIEFELDGQAFCDSYEAKGWLIGKTPMRDWRAAVRTWKRRGYDRAPAATIRKPFPGEIMKQLDELRKQRTTIYNRHEVNGSIPADKPQAKATHSALCDKIKQLEKELLAV